MFDLKGKIVLITGATSGIGEACVNEFAKSGATVILTGRNVNKGEEIEKQNKENNKNVYFRELDITNDSSIESLYEFIQTKFGVLDILYNNAGIYPVELGMGNITREMMLNIFDTNINGTILVTQRMIELIRKSRGVIINNASIGGMEMFTSGQGYAYTGSKAAVIKFSKMLAKKYGSEFRTNCICPGTIHTPIFKTFDEERMRTRIPMQRTGKPEEVAKVVAFLASNDASYINGCVLTIDGGQSL